MICLEFRPLSSIIYIWRSCSHISSNKKVSAKTWRISSSASTIFGRFTTDHIIFLKATCFCTPLPLHAKSIKVKGSFHLLSVSNVVINYQVSQLYILSTCRVIARFMVVTTPLTKFLCLDIIREVFSANDNVKQTVVHVLFMCMCHLLFSTIASFLRFLHAVCFIQILYFHCSL
jgi:hypothetical protein